MIRTCVTAVLAVMAAFASSGLARAADPYETYIKTSRDFRRVKQDRDSALKAWPSWTYMPWYYRWDIGMTEEGGRFSTEHGYNGAFLDNGRTKYLDWIDKFNLRFYMDHTASKGYLYLRFKSTYKNRRKDVHGTGMRFIPINEATTRQVKDIIRKNIDRVKGSRNRAAYALDDEISWGSFVKPSMWRVTDDLADFGHWLQEVYGAHNAPDYGGRWIGYEEVRKR